LLDMQEEKLKVPEGLTGVREKSVVPPGLESFFVTFPSAEALG